MDVRTPGGELDIEQRQFVEIARALSFGARFIVLDEPTARLDVAATALTSYFQEDAASLKLAATERHGVHVGFRSSIAGYRKVILGAVRLRPASGRGRAAGKSRRRDGSAPC